MALEYSSRFNVKEHAMFSIRKTPGTGSRLLPLSPRMCQLEFTSLQVQPLYQPKARPRSPECIRTSDTEVAMASTGIFIDDKEAPSASQEPQSTPHSAHQRTTVEREIFLPRPPAPYRRSNLPQRHYAGRFGMVTKTQISHNGLPQNHTMQASTVIAISESRSRIERAYKLGFLRPPVLQRE